MPEEQEQEQGGIRTMQQAFNAVNEALAVFRGVQYASGTREMGIAITNIETGMLWIIHDDRQRAERAAAEAEAQAKQHPDDVGKPVIEVAH